MSSPGSSKGTRTRHQSGSKLTEFVGPGKEFNLSEVPTLRAVIQRGILIKEKLLLEQGSAKKDIHVSEIVKELVPLIVAQWHKSNVKFSPPVTIMEHSIKNKVERLWRKIEEVVRGRGKKNERRRWRSCWTSCWTSPPAPTPFYSVMNQAQSARMAKIASSRLT